MKRGIKTRILLTSLALLLAIVPIGQVNADKMVPDDIRVGLFIEERGTVPVVSLQAEQGLTMGTNSGGQYNEWLAHHSSAPVRFSLDQYRLVLAEGVSQEEAVQLSSQVRAAVSGDVYVAPGETTSYRVIIGGLHSKQQANDMLERVKRFTTNGGKILAPHYFTTGSYATLAEAEEQLRELLHHNVVDAAVVLVENGAQISYSVWIHAPEHIEQAEAYREQLTTAMPHLSLQIVGQAVEQERVDQAEKQAEQMKQTDPSAQTEPSEQSAELDEAAETESPAQPSQSAEGEFYIILEEELSSDGQTMTRVRVASNESSEGALKIQSLGGSIQVQERFARNYRGSMEITTHKGRLALVNELPFEHYLYSVVGTEMGTGWPVEALKAQAVSARTFALKQGTKYGVAHVSDTTYEQAYYGMGREAEDVIAAVDATKGEVIVDSEGELITPFYSANAGGMTADATEVWSSSLHYLKSVPSPDDGPQKNLLHWHRVLLEDGTIGYVRSDYVDETSDRTLGGLKILRANASNVNVRSAPFVNNTINGPIALLQEGDQLIHLETRMEANSYQWITIPYRASDLKAVIEARANMTIDGPLTSLQVTERGPSARVTEVKANGQTIEVTSPDAYRTVLNNLRSTRFEIEESASFHVLGADGERQKWSHDEPAHVISANGDTTEFSEQMLVLNEGNGARLITREPTFTFIGTGFGHGVGMSQWGARELAEFMSFDYVQILAYYYNDIEITS